MMMNELTNSIFTLFFQVILYFGFSFRNPEGLKDKNGQVTFVLTLKEARFAYACLLPVCCLGSLKAIQQYCYPKRREQHCKGQLEAEQRFQ
jgi:hypothetical protein